jgi:hypothetical protein
MIVLRASNFNYAFIFEDFGGKRQQKEISPMRYSCVGLEA